MAGNKWIKGGVCSNSDSTTPPPGSGGDHRALSFRDADNQHLIGSIVGLQSVLDAKAAIVHQHEVSDVRGLVQALVGKADKIHTHLEADISDLDKYARAQVDSFLAAKSDIGHTHQAEDIPDLGDIYAPLIHLHDAVEIDFDNTDSGLAAEEVQAAIDELAGTLDPGEVFQAIIMPGSGDGLVSGDLNATDFTGHPESIGTALNIYTGDLYIFYYNNAGFLWAGPRGVTVGIGGTYISVPEDLIALSSSDHNVMLNRFSPNQHDVPSITGLQFELDNKADTLHPHVISDVTDLQDELDGKSDIVHAHVEADITDLDKYDTTEVDLLLTGKLDTTHVIDLPNVHVPTGGLQGQVLIKAGNGDYDVKWGYLEEVLSLQAPPPTTTPAPTTSI